MIKKAIIATNTSTPPKRTGHPKMLNPENVPTSGESLDPVILHWGKYQKAWEMTMAVEEATGGLYHSLDEASKAQYRALHPQFNPLLYVSIEHQRAHELANDAVASFMKTPAQSPKGLMLQIEYWASDNWVEARVNLLKTTIKAGIQNICSSTL